MLHGFSSYAVAVFSSFFAQITVLSVAGCAMTFQIRLSIQWLKIITKISIIEYIPANDNAMNNF